MELACISSDGHHLASLERRSEAELHQHICIKFWYLSNGSFRLAARMSQPHASVVSALAFHPQLLLVVSASFDNKFKLWEAREVDDGDGKGAVANGAAARAPLWSCRSVGYYRQALPCDNVTCAIAPTPASRIVDDFCPHDL